MRAFSRSCQSEIPIQYPPQVTAEDFEGPRQSRHFGSSSRRRVWFTKWRQFFLGTFYRPITAKCLTSGRIVHIGTLDTRLAGGVHFP
jgi:hypothetical protein